MILYFRPNKSLYYGLRSNREPHKVNRVVRGPDHPPVNQQVKKVITGPNHPRVVQRVKRVKMRP